jgi:hypothetical protein
MGRSASLAGPLFFSVVISRVFLSSFSERDGNVQPYHIARVICVSFFRIPMSPQATQTMQSSAGDEASTVLPEAKKCLLNAVAREAAFRRSREQGRAGDGDSAVSPKAKKQCWNAVARETLLMENQLEPDCRITRIGQVQFQR